MDKNTITGFVLIAAVLFGFSWFSRPSEEEIRAQHQQDSIAAVNKAKQDKRFLDDRPVTCDVLEYASSSVILVFRGWVRSEDYWNVFFEMNDDLKNVLKEAGAEIPYPRIDIHSK